jgi:hypothetical protein
MSDSNATTPENRRLSAAVPRLESPDIYPDGTQQRLCSVAMALQGASILLNEACGGRDDLCGVLGTLDLAVSELTRINEELESSFEREAGSRTTAVER